MKSSALGTGPWECRVEEGEAGPLFVVSEGWCDDDGGGGGEGTASDGGPRGRRSSSPFSFFSGPSPTRPWTDACLARATGQRISGPLFFGFSDPAVQAAVESLYSAEELAAARRGEGGVMRRNEAGNAGASGGAGGGGPSPSAASASAFASAERAARDFMARYGIGEATACVLAHTTALGGEAGRRFASADELEAWARGAGGGEEGAAGAGGAGGAGDDTVGWPPRARQLLDFLLGSEEFPASTRRWPAWRTRMAPRLVASVCGLGLRKEAEEEAGEKEEGKKKGRGGGRRGARGGSGVAAKTTTQQQTKKRATGAAAAAAAAASSARSAPVRATRSSRK